MIGLQWVEYTGTSTLTRCWVPSNYELYKHWWSLTWRDSLIKTLSHCDSECATDSPDVTHARKFPRTLQVWEQVLCGLGVNSMQKWSWHIVCLDKRITTRDPGLLKGFFLENNKPQCLCVCQYYEYVCIQPYMYLRLCRYDRFCQDWLLTLFIPSHDGPRCTHSWLVHTPG